VLRHYPIASLGEIPQAWTDPWPVGRENLSLYGLLHDKIRAFGDPRIHAAIVPAARSAPRLRGYRAATLDADLHQATAEYLATTMPERAGAPALTLPYPFKSFAGDFIAPARMPSVAWRVRGYLMPAHLRLTLRAYLPAETAAILDDPAVQLHFAPYDWVLNDVTTERVSPTRPAYPRR
jgi:hypothetical protein